MRKLIVGIAMPLALGAGMLSAQERPAREEGRRPAPTDQASRADQQIAAVKLAMCRNEVELAKLAEEKAESDEVKKFAAKMVQQHTEDCRKLEQRAGALGASGTQRTQPGQREAGRDQPAIRPAPGAEVRAQPGQPAQPGGARPGADPAARGSQGATLNWVRIHQEIADQCLESAQKLLGEKEGAEFDKCYIGLTIVSHQQAVDVDEVFANYVSREFQAELEECQQIAASHLDEAKEIMEGLANDQ